MVAVTGVWEPVAWAVSMRPAQWWASGTLCVAEATRTVEAAVEVRVTPFCAETSPKAARPRIINVATIVTTNCICRLLNGVQNYPDFFSPLRFLTPVSLERS